LIRFVKAKSDFVKAKSDNVLDFKKENLLKMINFFLIGFQCSLRPPKPRSMMGPDATGIQQKGGSRVEVTGRFSGSISH
jgi:hypothetical protein